MSKQKSAQSWETSLRAINGNDNFHRPGLLTKIGGGGCPGTRITGGRFDLNRSPKTRWSRQAISLFFGWKSLVGPRESQPRCAGRDELLGGSPLGPSSLEVLRLTEYHLNEYY